MTLPVKYTKRRLSNSAAPRPGAAEAWEKCGILNAALTRANTHAEALAGQLQGAHMALEVEATQTPLRIFH